MPITLHARPPGIRQITDVEGAWLKEMYPGMPPTLAQCITCGGTKTFRWKALDGHVVDYDCNCVDQRIMHRYFTVCGLGLRYQRLGWQDATGVDDTVMAEAIDYVDHMGAYMRTGRGLILRGATTGTGKTLVAALLFKKMLAEGHDGYFVQFNRLLDMEADGWGRGESAEENRRWFTRRIRNAGVLVIDDIGREYAGRGMERIEATLDTIIRARHDDCKPTIITTNKDGEFFSQRYQGNVMSLLLGTCQVIDVPGVTDHRDWAQEQADYDAKHGLVRPVVVG